MRRILVLFVLSCGVASCGMKPYLSGQPPPLDKEGALFVYLAPLPLEAAKLSFDLAELHAERQDGGRIPLSLRLMKIDPREASRERLLAYGTLPPGAYSGFSLRVGMAALEGEEGATSLKLAEGMTTVPAPFTVERKRAVVMDLKLRFPDSIREGFRFTPAFSASIPKPGMIAAGRLGLSTSREANAVTVFDKVSGQVVYVIPTGEAPAGVAMDPMRRRAYVALSGEDAVEVIDLLEVRVLERIRLSGGDAPLDLSLTPDGRTLLVANSGSNTVSVVDPLAMFEKEKIPVGAAPQSVLLDRAGKRGYSFNALSNTISVLDIPRATVAATIPTESGPVRGDLSPDGSRLYLLQQGSSYLGIVDTASLSVARGAYVGSGAKAIKVDPRTGWIYLARRDSVEVEVYDPSSLLPVDFLPAGGEAAYLAIDGEESDLWIVLPGQARLHAVGLVSKRTTAAVDVGEGPRRVAIMGER
jgi:YVTN family beta-propeller protein